MKRLVLIVATLMLWRVSAEVYFEAEDFKGNGTVQNDPSAGGGKIVTGRKYVWKTNGLLPEGSYTFDDAGKMLGAAVEDGIVVSGEIVEIGDHDILI